MKTVGYLEGTDPILLTRLVAKGYGTVPLSNGWDNHGKYIGHITKGDDISVVIGYLHKVMPLPGQDLEVGDVLFACRIHKIPVLLIVPKEFHRQVAKSLGDVGDMLYMVDPKNIFTRLTELLEE